MWEVLIGGIAFVAGYFLGVRDRAYKARKQLRRIENEDRKRQEATFREIEESEKKEAQNKERRALAQSTRAALDFGYTLQQILEWAYTEVFFEDFQPEPRKTQVSNYGTTTFCESQAEADNRRMQARYDYLRKVLLGKSVDPLLQRRNILEAMQKAGIQTTPHPMSHDVLQETPMESKEECEATTST